MNDKGWADVLVASVSPPCKEAPSNIVYLSAPRTRLLSTKSPPGYILVAFDRKLLSSTMDSTTMTKYIVSLLPIMVSVLSLLVNFIHGSTKNKTGIVDTVSKELSNKNSNPYVLQACIARLHNSRPIPATILKKLLSYDNAFEIIQLISYGRKVLDIFSFNDSGGKITVGYSDAYKLARNRWGSGLLCLCAMLFCYYLSITTLIELIKSVDVMTERDSKTLSTWIGLAPNVGGLLFSMMMNFMFSWQFQIILFSKKRIEKIQILLDAGRCVNFRGCATIR